MMSSSGFRPFDDLSEHYEDEWLQLSLEDETLKCSSPPAGGAVEFGLTLSTRSCPSPLSHIPTRELYASEPPPKLSPVSVEQQTFITLSNSRISSAPPGPSHPVLQSPSQVESSELTSVDYELNPDLSVLSIPSTSPLLVTKATDLQFTQPSVSGLHQNGDFASFVQLEQRGKRAIIQPQQHPPGCVHAVNGQWFVQAQVQHVQTSAGTVIAVVPNFCRQQSQSTGNSQNLSQVQVSQSQLVAHPAGNGQTVNAAHSATVSAQHVIQNHPQHQIQRRQESQQMVHAARMSCPLTAGVTSGASQQGQSVMQHLLSQPVISRSQVATAQAVTTVPAASKKQRNCQPRNGRRKNINQGGTLGSVLIKANKLAAAASADASINQLLPPSHGIEMRLSVQNSEQVANLSKEISRLQNLNDLQQTAYNVDHSAEIKELENKRAQIFFEALAQQHKDKDLLSAVNSKPLALAPHVKQRNHNRNSHNSSGQATVVIHQVQPSTSCEQHQQQPTLRQRHQLNYEAATPTRVPVSYPNSYQISTHYTPAHETLPSSQFSVRSNDQTHQVSTTQYQTTISQPSVQQNQIRENYIHSVPGAAPQATILQLEQPISRVVGEVPCEPPPSSVPLFPPPILRSSVETATCVTKKKVERSRRISDFFLSLHYSVEHPDMSSPFHDLSDVLQRLLPFHIYSEPDFNSEILDTFDYHCLRHFVHLNNRRYIIEQRMRSLLCKEAMKFQEGYSKADECLLLSLDAEHERRLLDEEKRMAVARGKEEFVANSAICTMNGIDIEERRRELMPKTIPKLHFDYHTFSEAEIAARTVSPFTTSDSEESSLLKSMSSDNEERMLYDAADEILVFEESTINNIERAENDPEIKEIFAKTNGEGNRTTNNWTDSNPSFDFTSREKNDSMSSHQKSCSPVATDTDLPEQIFFVKSAVPSTRAAEQEEEVIISTDGATLGRISSPVIAEENESIENCFPIENCSKISEVEAESCDNESSQVLERKGEGEKIERPPIRIKIALTDTGLKYSLNKCSSKKNKEKRKKKRKRYDFRKTGSEEINSLLPSYSGLEDTKSGDSTLHRDGTSHPRILMRITRKNNIVSVTDPLTNHISLHITPKSRIDEEGEPPLKVPKLKIRLGRKRDEHVVGSEQPTVDHITRSAQPEEDKLEMRFGNNDHGRLNRHERTTGMDHNRKMTIIIPKSVIENSYASSCNPSNSISAPISSNAQFSPSSEISDEEEDEQLRAQADSVISRLNDWGTTNPVAHQIDALSRLVGTAPLVTPVLDRLVPNDPWFINMNIKNHSTINSNDTASSRMTWLTSAASHPRSLKTTVSVSKPN